MYPAFASLAGIAPYGVALVVALICCWAYARRRARKRGIDVSHIDLAVPLVFLIAIAGAKVFSLISAEEANLAGEILQAHGRLRLFGLLILAVPALLLYCRIVGLSFRTMADVLALPALLWLAIVRLGCFAAGCCWGDVTVDLADMQADLDAKLARQIQTVPWLAGRLLEVSFPVGSFAYQQHLALGLIGPDASAALPVHPTQLYESILAVLLLVFLLILEARQQRPGSVSVSVVAGYAATRFLIEFLRADNSLVLGTLTLAQAFCLVLLCLAAAASIALRRRA